MELKFIQDKERNFNKEDEGDFLDYSNYVSNLEDIIKNAPDTSFTIGLFGGWGSGKSSIINTVKDNLKDEKIKFITYDAWKYSDDPFRRTFLFTILKDLNVNLQPMTNFRPIDYEFLNKHFYNDIQKEVSTTFKNNRYIIILPVALLVCIYFRTSNNFPSDVISIISLSVSIFTLSIYPLKTQINEHFMFAPEQFESCFNKLMDSISSENNNKTSKTLPNYFNKLKNSIFRKEHDKNSNRYDKIVFVIDNLDRCSGSEVIEKLKTIKTFLCDRENIIFLIPLDDDSLKKYLFKLEFDETNKIKMGNNDYSMNLLVNEFLRKIFDVSLRIKTISNMNIKYYGNLLQEEYNLNISKDIERLISDNYVNNPRGIIQFFNNLQVELNNYEQDFRNKYETYICKILIIREEYPNIYNYLSNNFMDAMELNPPNKENLGCSDDEFEKFKTFNEATSYVSGINEIKAFNKIFYHSEKVNHLPNFIIDAIDSNNYDPIDKFCTNDENKELLLREIYFSIEDNYYKENFDMVMERIKLLLYLYKNDKLNVTKVIENIESILKRMMHPIIDEFDNFKMLLLYSKDNEKDWGNDSLIYYIINIFREKFDADELDISYLKEIFEIFDENEEVLKLISPSLVSLFARYNEDKDEILDLFKNLTPIQLKVTYSRHLADYLINVSFYGFDFNLKCLNCYLDVLDLNERRYIFDRIYEKSHTDLYEGIQILCFAPLLRSLKEDPSFDTKFKSFEQRMENCSLNDLKKLKDEVYK